MVQLMTYEHRGMYLTLLIRQHIEGSIPGEKDMVRDLLRLNNGAFDSFWEVCSSKFGMCEDGRRRNLKMIEVAKEYAAKCKQAKDAATKRWSEKVDDSRNADAMRAHNRTQCDPDPDPDKEEEKNKTGGAGGVHEEHTSKKKPKRDVKAQLREIHEWFDTLPTHQGQPIDEAVGRVGSTHLSGKLTSIQKIEFIHRGRSYGIEAMVSGCKVYNDGEMQARGYDVDYLIGIIRKEATRCKKKILMDS